MNGIEAFADAGYTKWSHAPLATSEVQGPGFTLECGNLRLNSPIYAILYSVAGTQCATLHCVALVCTGFH
jgi:hypothetical protein